MASVSTGALRFFLLLGFPLDPLVSFSLGTGPGLVTLGFLGTFPTVPDLVTGTLGLSKSGSARVDIPST